MTADRLGSPVAMRWMVLGEWRAHPVRVVVAALAIAVGVALGFAVHLVNASALNDFAHAVSTVNGNADLQVQSATPAGFDEALYPKLARIDGVETASPVVDLTATTDTGMSLTLQGIDVLRAATVTPGLIGHAEGATKASPFDPAIVFLSEAALQATGLHPGDRINLAAGGRAASFVIAGTLPDIGQDQRIAVVDIAAAQWRFGQLGRLQRIDLRLVAGADPGMVERDLRAVLPADADVVSPQNEAQRSDSLSRAYRVNLEMLAMVALLTGGFLVYSAQSLSVTRRRPQFALLRVLGLRRRDLLIQLFVEGAVVGLAGALCGIALGFGLALLALRVLGGDLGGGYFSAARPVLVFPVLAALILLGLGVAVALGGSLWPALDASRAQPAVALKNTGASGDPRRRPTAWIGLTLLIIGGLAALAPPIWGLPLFGYVSIALLLAGGVAGMPWLAGMLLTPLRRLRNPGAVLDLAVKRLWGAPSQAAVALCGIVASTSLMIAMAVMVSSFRGSVDDWLIQILPSDLYLHVEHAESGGLDPDLQRRLAALPEIASIRFRKITPLRLAPGRPAVALMAQPVDLADPGGSLPLLGAALPVPLGEVPVWISEPLAWLYPARPGGHMMLPIGNQAQRVFVAGIWRDYARQFGAIVIADGDYTRLTGDPFRTDAAIDLAPGASAPGVIAALRAALPPNLTAQTNIAEPRQIRVTALRVFDRSFAATYALEGIAIVIGLTGVAATLSAQTLARTKEFGMLRHIGVLRRQIILMLAAEGALLGVVGGIAGLGLGIAMGEVLIQVVNPQSFHWTMETRLPLGLFAVLVVALVVAASGTSVLAGSRAVSSDAVRAVREDW